MASVTAMEAESRFGELLDRVVRGEEIVITQHQKPVARLVPERRDNLNEVREAVAGLRELQRQIAGRLGSAAAVTDAEARSWVEEGRP